MKRAVGYMAFRRALSINILPRAILAFVYMCLLTHRLILIQSNFDTLGDTSRSDTNRFSRGVQPIFRDICFCCSRAITIHQVIVIVLQFHCLHSYQNDYFPLQLIDQITFLLSCQMCHVWIKLCVRPLSLTHSNTNHKTNSACSGSGF